MLSLLRIGLVGFVTKLDSSCDALRMGSPFEAHLMTRKTWYSVFCRIPSRLLRYLQTHEQTHDASEGSLDSFRISNLDVVGLL